MNLKFCASRCPGGQLGQWAKLKLTAFIHSATMPARGENGMLAPQCSIFPQNGTRWGPGDRAQTEGMPWLKGSWHAGQRDVGGWWVAGHIKVLSWSGERSPCQGTHKKASEWKCLPRNADTHLCEWQVWVRGGFWSLTASPSRKQQCRSGVRRAAFPTSMRSAR